MHVGLVTALMIAAVAVASPIIVQTADDVVPESSDFVQADSGGTSSDFHPTSWMNPTNWFSGPSAGSSGSGGNPHEHATRVLPKPVVHKTAETKKAQNSAGKTAAVKATKILRTLVAATKKEMSLLREPSTSSTNKAESLKQAVAAGDWRLTKQVIDSGVSVNAMLDSKGRTALMMAVQRDDSKMVETLMHLGANVMIQDTMGRTAFEYCTHMPSEVKMVQKPAGKTLITKALLDQHTIMQKLMAAKKKPVSLQAESLKRAVQVGDSQLAKQVIDGGADVNSMLDSDGRTALMMAVQHGNSTMVETLTALGANVMIQDLNGHTAFSYCESKSAPSALAAESEFSQFGFLDPTTWFSDPPPPPPPTKSPVHVDPRVQVALKAENQAKVEGATAQVNKQMKAVVHAKTHASMDSMQHHLEVNVAAAVNRAHKQLKQASRLQTDTTEVSKAEVKRAHTKAAVTTASTDIAKAVADSQKAVTSARLDLENGKAKTRSMPSDQALADDLKESHGSLGKDPFAQHKTDKAESSAQQMDQSVMKDVTSLSKAMTHGVVDGQYAL